MRRLPVPQLEARAVYTSAADAFDDAELHARYLAAQTAILSEERCYASLARVGRLDQVRQSQTVNSTLSVADMKDLYKKGMSSASGPARPFYDSLMSAAPHGTCPSMKS